MRLNIPVKHAAVKTNLTKRTVKPHRRTHTLTQHTVSRTLKIHCPKMCCPTRLLSTAPFERCGAKTLAGLGTIFAGMGGGSHAIFSITIEQRKDEECISAKFHFVDLAGVQ